MIAQFDNSIKHPDTTRILFPKTHGTKKWKPVIGFDAHRSFFAGTPVKINGFKFGVDYLGTHRFGFGFYGLNKNAVFVDIPVDYPSSTDTSLVKFNVNYAAIFYERVFIKTKRWEIAIPAYLGAGGLEGHVEDTLGIFRRFTASSFSSFSTGTFIKYYLLKWLAPKLGLGYRFMFNTDKPVRKAFNGPYYSFGLSMMVGELYRTFKTFSEKRKKSHQPSNP